MSTGRPPLSREPLYEQICRLPRAGRRLRNVSARKLAKDLGYDRETVGVMLDDLEAAGRIRRLRNKGRSGTLVEILTGNDSGLLKRTRRSEPLSAITARSA